MEKGGDAISLVAQLLNINNYEAAQSINQKFGLGINNSKVDFFEINKYQEKKKIEESFKSWEHKTILILMDYYHLLQLFKSFEDPTNDLYVEACHYLDYINNIIDEIFLNGTNEDKIWFWKNNRKLVMKIESRVRAFRTID